jgi:hypothetical protein
MIKIFNYIKSILLTDKNINTEIIENPNDTLDHPDSIYPSGLPIKPE